MDPDCLATMGGENLSVKSGNQKLQRIASSSFQDKEPVFVQATKYLVLFLASPGVMGLCYFSS